MRRSSSRVYLRILVCCLFLCAVVCAVPSVALARSYSIDKVNIDATVGTDGSLHIRESRRFSFSGAFHGVYWNLVKGSYNGRTVEPVVNEVGEMRGGSFASFAENDSESDGSYQVNGRSSYDELKVFSSHMDDEAEFVIDYTYQNLASRWGDTAELYWKFVSDGWDVPSNNVTCTVHLPVPDGASVMPEKNVRAWGHGPLDANVSFSGNDVVYSVPGVGTSEFAEARITFPEEWLPDAQKQSSDKLQTILGEEQRWADEANTKRTRVRILLGVMFTAMAACGIVPLVMSLVKWRAYRRAHKPQFDDTYFRDVPSNDHPAVLGALYKGGSPGSEDFTASLMRLTDNEKLQLDLVKYTSKGMFGRKKEREDYRLLEIDRVEGSLRGDAVAASCDRIDRAAMKFLFRTVAEHHDLDDDLMGPNGERYVLTSYFKEVARKHPEAYENGYKDWEASVTSSLETRGFLTEEGGKKGKVLCIVLGILGFFAGIGLMVFSIMLDLPILPAILLSLFDIAGAVISIVVSTKMVPRSREAIELNAKLHALRRWLKEFTRLDEAIPTDVVLWNRLLVIATALGVADEVVDQIKVAMPQMLDDPYFYTYGWYYYGHRHIGAPARVIGSSFGEAHSVSAGKLASSSNSSGGGGGGGFSGGGGGGFGGGGGGGAF